MLNLLGARRPLRNANLKLFTRAFASLLDQKITLRDLGFFVEDKTIRNSLLSEAMDTESVVKILNKAILSSEALKLQVDTEVSGNP